MALFWLKLSQERGGYFEYWNNAEFQVWPSETEEGGLLYYLALEVNTSVMLAADIWRQILSWAALLGISMIEATDEGKAVGFETVTDLPERWREKLRSSFADLIAHEEAVDLISQGYFQGNEVLFADARQYLTASCESARELVVGYNWFAAQNSKEQIDTEGSDVRALGRVEKLLNQWVRLSRGKALVATGKVFEGRDEILAALQPRK
jgi:hypothetical protein